MKYLSILKACFALLGGFCVTDVMAIDACNENGGHAGKGAKAPNFEGETVIEKIAPSDYVYTWWYSAGENSMTYYDDGSFSIQWSGDNVGNSFLGGVGLSFGYLKSYSDVGQLGADFNFAKSGNADSYSYMGVFGSAANSTKEFYIIEDWFTKPNLEYLGEKQGEITVDGATYDIYFNRIERKDKLGLGDLLQVFSVRRTPRQCGHIDITAHFKKWDALGFNVSPFKYVWIYAEGSSEKDSGSVDFTYAKVTRSEVVAGGDVKSTLSAEYASSNNQEIHAPAREVEGTTVAVSKNKTEVGEVGNSGYHYDIWASQDGGSITYYDDGSFSAEWNGATDFIAGVGYRYDSDKTYMELGPFSADFEFTKSGTTGYSFIGVHGWTQNPMTEFYVVEDQFVKSKWEEFCEKKGEITVDGDTYDIYTMYVVRAVDAPTFWVVYSVRRNDRQSGHVDITAHMEKWEELGIKLGNLYEVMLWAEANGGAGYVDYTIAKVHQGSDFFTTKATMARPQYVEGTARVFDMQGRFLGKVELSKGVDVSEVLKAHFDKAGIYVVKNSAFTQMVPVNK